MITTFVRHVCLRFPSNIDLCTLLQNRESCRFCSVGVSDANLEQPPSRSTHSWGPPGQNLPQSTQPYASTFHSRLELEDIKVSNFQRSIHRSASRAAGSPSKMQLFPVVYIQSVRCTPTSKHCSSSIGSYTCLSLYYYNHGYLLLKCKVHENLDRSRNLPPASGPSHPIGG